MATPAHVHRLGSYGLTLAGLTRLGNRQVRATVQLSGKTARALLLRRVREGRSVVVTSHGKPVAKIVPIGDSDDGPAQGARAALFTRLQTEPVVNVGRWTRDELYER